MIKNLVQPTTLVELLRQRAQKQPDKRAYTFLKDGETEEASLTYAQLDQRAQTIAAGLQNLTVLGDRALLLYPPGLDYIAAFFGCLYAGVVAVPTYPPRRNRPDPRIQAIVTDAQATVVLTTSDILSDMTPRLAQAPELKNRQWFATDNLTNDFTNLWQNPEIHSDTLAFLQYTSGSTGMPKGVMVSHGNVLYNEEMLRLGFGHTENTIGVGWLPLFHDMGLMGNVLQPLYLGIPCILMSPVAFLQKPYRWLQAISRYHATSSGGPNFAYDLCIQKITPEQRAQLDLSHWEVAFSGAEPIRAETLDRFAETFKACGFRREAFYPCYGMAETTLIVSGGLKTNPPVVYQVEKAALQQNRVVAMSAGEDTQKMVGCGQTWLAQKMVIVDPDTFIRCSDQHVGEIWISGPNVAQGYWNKPDETEQTFHAYLAYTGEGPFLRTGDLGFLKDGELFVTGRLKDLIIIRGRNYYPQDIELTVEKSHTALCAGGGAAFSVEGDGEERLVIVQEVQRTSVLNLNVNEVVTAIRQAVSEQHELPVDAVLLLKTNSIPKTSSGKIQRRACLAGFLANNLNVLGEWQRPITDKTLISEFKQETIDNKEINNESIDNKDIDNKKILVKQLPNTEAIQRWLATKISQQVGIAPNEIDIKQPFNSYGIDSVTAVSLSGELAEWLGQPLSPTLIYDYPTIEALAKSLTNKIPPSYPVSKGENRSQRGGDFQSEAIAIIGVGCRFPKAKNPNEFWQLLKNGVDAITEIPTSRWDTTAFYEPTPATPGKMNTRWGGFIDDVDQFEPTFFGISPREAERMDPQQRLLLKISWEALENAGIPAESVVGSQTGVFIGLSSNDYRCLLCRSGADLNAYSGTGNALSIAANRLSYWLDLHGPSKAVDTACSSSFVAVHDACQSLRQHECELALAGGVNLILTPDLTMTFSAAQMLSPDGRCKTFDAEADGYVRGEGGGIIVLKRLSDAIRDGDNVLALIKGSAVNQDGRSNGLTAPNGPAQQAVIRQALANAGVAASELSYVEAHGTGTSLGDPIEFNALKEVLMSGRSPEQLCYIGSVKTNIGHLEAAAGIAGLIKIVLALQHQKIPQHLHLKTLNPLIAIADTPLLIPTVLQPWPRGNKRRLAGLSSFGFGGTNVHVIVEEAPLGGERGTAQKERSFHLLTLSAKSEMALCDLAPAYDAYFQSHPAVSIADVCFTTHTGRSHFASRLALVADSYVQLQEQLGAFVEGDETAGLVSGQVQSGSKRATIAFLFTGQGAQYVGMGQRLYDTQPLFRQTLERCADILQYTPSPSQEGNKPLLEVLYPKSEGRSQLDETAYTQPALFALEYALAKLWQSWGIMPEVVMGHSVGEYVAACIAEVFSLEDGLKLIAARGRLMQTRCEKGAMLVLSVDETRAAEIIKPFAPDVSIAAINGPENVVISGKYQAIETIMATLNADGIKTKRLPVSHAFHSAMMEPMLTEFERIAAEVTYSVPQIPLCSNVTGQLATEEIATAAYWVRHVRQPVRFAASMETLYQQGYEIFVEIGPKPALLGMGRQCLPDGVGTWLVSLRQGQDDWQQLLHSLGSLYVRGAPIDWLGFDHDYPRLRVELPTYPFQRQRYWIDTGTTNAQRQTLWKKRGSYHPLLGQRLHSAVLKNKEIVFESELQSNRLAYVAPHRLLDTNVLPIAAYLEMVLAAGRTVFNSELLRVEKVVIQQPLTLPEDEVKTCQLILTPVDTSTYCFEIFSSLINDDNPSWTSHVSGQILVGESPNNQVDLADWKAQCLEDIAIADYFQQYQNRGIDYGASVQAIEKIWRHKEKALGQIQLPESWVTDVANLVLHPMLLDASFLVLGALLPKADKKEIYMPIGLERLCVYRQPEHSIWSAAIRQPANESTPNILTADVSILTQDGQLLAVLEGIQLQKVNLESWAVTQASWQDWLYEIQWQPQLRFGKQPDYIPSPQEISTRLQPYLTSSIAQIAFYQQLLPQLDSLSVDYILIAFQQLGWVWKLNQRFSTPTIAEQLGVVTQHQRLLNRLLEMLMEDGLLKHQDDSWEVSRVPDIQDPQKQNNTLLTQYPAAQAELTLLARCGAKLAQVLQGDCDPPQLLFPDGDLTAATQIYQTSPGAQVMNTLVQQAVLSAVERLPQGQGVRVLELGAGTGGTTAFLLPHLPVHQTDYVFTDLSPLFTTQAQEKFSDYPFVRYQLLDIEQAPDVQGFGEHQYDIIVAANVLHATKDLAETLQHIHRLLNPGGMLVLLEGTARLRWLDLIFGLTEGWWRFTDHQLRSAYPLISASQWQTLLNKNGFKEAVTISPEQEGVLFQQAVIITQAATTVSPTSLLQTQENWLIFSDRQGLGQQLATHLQARNETAILVFSGQAYEQIATEEFRINPTNPSDFQQLLRELTKSAGRDLHKIIHLWSLDAATTPSLTATDLKTALQQGCGSTVHLIQALVNTALSVPPALWLVTRGAQPVTIQNPSVPGLAQSPLWGLGKVIALEHPEIWGGLLDLSPNTDKDEAATILADVLESENEDHIAFRDGQRYVARLVRCSLPKPEGLPLRPDSTYLITGGLGTSGLNIAQWMVKQGVRHLVLMGRRGPSSTTQAILNQLEQADVQVIVAKADVSKEEDVNRVLKEIDASCPPLRGIVHTAGIAHYQALKETDLNTFETVFLPKVIGTWTLSQLTQHKALDFLVCFSSMVSVWGAKMQSDYIAANHFLDVFAHYRQGLGMRTLTINWGPFAGGGLLTSDMLTELTKMGIEALQPEQVVNIFGNLLGTRIAQITVANIDWSVFKPLYEAQRSRPLLAKIEERTRKTTSRQSVQRTDILQQLEHALKSERQDLLITYLQGEVAQVLGFKPAQVNPKLGFFDMGMDSLTTIELKKRLEASLETTLPATLAFDHPTIHDLAGYIAKEILGEETPATTINTFRQSDVEKISVSSEVEPISEEDIETSIAQELAELETLLKRN